MAIRGCFLKATNRGGLDMKKTLANLEAAAIGTVTITDGPSGLVLTPALKDLPPGVHGFHVHQNADCSAGEKDGKKGLVSNVEVV